MKNLILFASILSVIIFSCDITKPETNINKILPLVVGNAWNYKSLEYTYDSVDSNLTIIDSSFIQMVVVKVDTLDSFYGYFIDNFFINLGWEIYFIFNNKKDGLYVAQKKTGISPRPGSTIQPISPKIVRLLSYPTYVGDTLTYDSDLLIKTTSLNDNIVISNNSFNCIVYEALSNGKLLGKFWMHPNIGLIKSWQLYGKHNVEHKLVYYNLN